MEVFWISISFAVMIGIYKIFLIKKGAPDPTLKQIADTIDEFLDGKGGPYDWHDFVTHHSYKDPKLEGIRKECAGIGRKFPPDDKKAWCSELGKIELLKISERISEELKKTADVRRKTMAEAKAKQPAGTKLPTMGKGPMSRGPMGKGTVGRGPMGKTQMVSPPVPAPMPVVPVLNIPTLNVPAPVAPVLNTIPAGSPPVLTPPPVETLIRLVPANMGNAPALNMPAGGVPPPPVMNLPVANQPSVNAPVLNIPTLNTPVSTPTPITAPVQNGPVTIQPLINVPVVTPPVINPPPA
jgi:hypothetical protein